MLHQNVLSSSQRAYADENLLVKYRILFYKKQLVRLKTEEDLIASPSSYIPTLGRY